MNEFMEGDTAKLQNQNLRYKTAVQVESCVVPNTAKELSKIPTVWTIPTADQVSYGDKGTNLR